MLEGFRLGVIVMVPGWQIAIVENWNLLLSYCALNIITLDLFNADEVDVAIEYLCAT